MKRLCAIFLMLGLLFTLGGCTGAKQLNERLIIQGIGVDYYGGEYTVSLMCMNTEDPDNEASAVKTVVTRGRTVFDTITNAISQTGQEPLYGHNMFIILGDTICSRGVGDVLDFFVDYYEARATVTIFAAKCRAGNIITQEGTTPKQIANLALTEKNSGRTTATPLYKFISALENKTQCPVAASLNIRDKEIFVDGTAVFKDGKQVCALDESQTMGALLINGKAGVGTEVIELKGENKSFSLSHTSSKMDFNIDKGTLNCMVDIKGTAKMYENKNADTSELKKSIDMRVRELCKSVWQTAVTDNQTDIFNIGRALNIKDNVFYNSVNDWNKVLSKANVKFNIDINVE